MPLKKKCSLEAFDFNVQELIRAGYPPKQAVAIAHDVLRKACKEEGKPVPQKGQES